MPNNPTPALSVADMFAQREGLRRKEKEAEEQLMRKQQEALSAFKKRLDEFQVTEAQVQSVLARIKRAFDRGENELMLTSFPSSFCSDSGRAITNAGRSPITKPASGSEGTEREPEWLATLPAGAQQVYDYWKANLKPGGFSFTARIINYPGGMPGDVGLFFSWPKSAMEAQS